MLTVQQITDAHSQVKSGADFPRYIQDLIKIGVSEYTIYVKDGHAEYFGQNGFSISSESKYPIINISSQVNIYQFKSDLKNHQMGNTNYMTFINDCAKSGIFKRTMNLDNMTCIYYDIYNNNLLEEKIPSL